MTVNYNGGGAYWRNVPIIGATGIAPIAAVANGLFTAVLPVAGVRTAISIAAQPDVPRNVTFGIVDADSGIAVGSSLQIYGTDSQDRVLQETITATVVGTATWTGALCFKTITSAYFSCPATVSGADTVQGGYGNILGLPFDIGAVADVKNRRQDANAAVGTILIASGTHGTWTLSGGNIPNAARLYFLDIQSTA